MQYIKQGGTWRAVGSAWVKVAGSWKQVFPPAANFSNTATGTYSSGGKNYKWLDFTGNGTLAITQAGIMDIYVLGGGGGGSAYNYCGDVGSQDSSCGGDGGGVSDGTVFIPTTGNYTVTIGAASAANGNGNATSISGVAFARGGSRGKTRGNESGRGASGSGQSGRSTSIPGSTLTHGGGGGKGSSYLGWDAGGAVDGSGAGGGGTGGGTGSNAAANRGGGGGGAPWRFCDQGTGATTGGSGRVYVRVEV